ncbi:MAG: hypothetical protein BWX51_01083 [Bacteroidetes bacterium ADurb.Bin012]|jgi:hypothetical protein|nr:MAG: hypothetical protein BWX51_01083 [Bacteroidetes bacterium ADurb.Bin012]
MIISSHESEDGSLFIGYQLTAFREDGKWHFLLALPIIGSKTVIVIQALTTFNFLLTLPHSR